MTNKLNYGLLIGFSLIFGFAALHFGQDYTWDGRDYHFYNGYALLNHRLTWDFAPVFIQSYINPLWDVLNYVMIVTLSAKAISFANGAISGICLFFSYLIAKELFADFPQRLLYPYIFFAVTIGATCTDNLALLGLITNDNKATLLTILSLYFIVRAFKHSACDNLIIAGLIMGFGTALKLTGASYAVAAVVALFYGVLRGDFRWQLWFIFSLAAFGGFLLGNGYWMYALYHNFHSPLFPFYNKIFHSPFAPQTSIADPLYYPHDYFIYPYLVGFYKTTTEEHLRDMRFAVIYTLAILWLLKTLIPNKKPATNVKAPWNFMLVWFLAAYLIWFFTFTIFRYALQLEIISGIVIVYLLDRVTDSSKIKMILLVLITLSLFATTVRTPFLRTPYHAKLFYAKAPNLPYESIVFINGDAIGYVIPYFQKDVHFVGDTSITNTEKLDALVKNNIDKVYVLNIINRKNLPFYFKDYLQTHYGLVLSNRCNRFTTNIGDEIEVCATTKG